MAEFKLDCMGDLCPIPLMKTKKKVQSMNVGDTLVVSIDHSCAAKNIPEWSRKLGNRTEVKKTRDGEWEITIKKER